MPQTGNPYLPAASRILSMAIWFLFFDAEAGKAILAYS
jgi:hypothetical protein